MVGVAQVQLMRGLVRGPTPMKKRHRFKQSISFRDRLASFANEAREKAARLPPGVERDEMLAKVRQADVASRYESWFNSAASPSEK
jgi:hypothetical protein